MNLIVAVISASVEIFLVLGGLPRRPRSTQYAGAILVVVALAATDKYRPGSLEEPDDLSTKLSRPTYVLVGYYYNPYPGALLK